MIGALLPLPGLRAVPLLVLFLGAWTVSSPRSSLEEHTSRDGASRQDGSPRASSGESGPPSHTPSLAELVGWYRMPAGDTALVTWAAAEGLRIFSLMDTLYTGRIVGGPEGELHWGALEGPEIEVRRGGGRIIGFEWSPPDAGEEQLDHEVRNDLDDDWIPGFLDLAVHPISIWTIKRRRPAWWDVNGPIDPLEHWGGLDAPGLVVYGAEDEHDNVPVAKSVMRLRGLEKPNLEVSVFQNTGHGLAEEGSQRIRADVMEQVVGWILEAVEDEVEG